MIYHFLIHFNPHVFPQNVNKTLCYLIPNKQCRPETKQQCKKVSKRECRQEPRQSCDAPSLPSYGGSSPPLSSYGQGK